jgi:hypothetical protein
MFHRLQEQFTTTIAAQAQQIADQAQEIQALKEEVAHIRKITSNGQI